MPHANDRIRCAECNRFIAVNDEQAIHNEKASYCRMCAYDYRDRFDDNEYDGAENTLPKGCLGSVIAIGVFTVALQILDWVWK